MSKGHRIIRKPTPEIPLVTIGIDTITYENRTVYCKLIVNEKFRRIFFDSCINSTFENCAFERCVFLQNEETSFKNCSFDTETIIINASKKHTGKDYTNEYNAKLWRIINTLIDGMKDVYKDKDKVKVIKSNEYGVIIGILYDNPRRLNIFVCEKFDLYTFQYEDKLKSMEALKKKLKI